MDATSDDLCVVCNDRNGVVRRLDVAARGGERRRYELVLCRVCAAAFDDADPTTVDAPADSQSAE